MSRQQLSLFDRKLLGPALLQAVSKLDPRVQWRNPVMFVVYVGTIITAALFVQALGGRFSMQTAPDTGTTVHAEFPLGRPTGVPG